jgi:DNA-binding HxlR family transcriptional regulator
MDVRTSQLLRALDPLAADVILHLLTNKSSEKELVEAIDGALQPTVHKKLRRLSEIGVVRQNIDASGRGSPWILTAPREVAGLLAALISLAEALDRVDRCERVRISEGLTMERTEMPTLRVVKSDQ